MCREAGGVLGAEDLGDHGEAEAQHRVLARRRGPRREDPRRARRVAGGLERNEAGRSRRRDQHGSDRRERERETKKDGSDGKQSAAVARRGSGALIGILHEG